MTRTSLAVGISSSGIRHLKEGAEMGVKPDTLSDVNFVSVHCQTCEYMRQVSIP